MLKEDSTPDKTTEDQAADQPLPEESIEASSEIRQSAPVEDTDNNTQPQDNEEQSSQEAPEESDSAGAPSGNEEDSELEEWAQKEGIDFNNPTPQEAKRLAKRLRDTQNKLHQTTQKKSELQKNISKQEPNETESEALLNEMRLHNFYANTPEALEYDQKMAEVYLDYQDNQPEFAGYLKRNLNVLYDLARANDAGKSVAEARQKGKSDALKSTARSQAAGAPQSNAKPQGESQKVTADKVQKWASNPESYKQHREEIMAWERKQMGL